MAKKDFDKKNLDDFKKSLKETYDTQQKLGNNMSDYLAGVEKLGKIFKNISFIEKQRLEQSSKINNLQKDLDRGLTSEVGKSGKELKILKKQNNELLKKLKIEKQTLGIIDDNLNSLKSQTTELKKHVNSSNAISASFKSVNGFLKSTPSLVKAGFGKLKSLGILEMDKAIRNARLEMGIFSKQGDAFYNNIENISYSTNNLGIGIEELAKMQSQYSNEIGRSVQFTQASSDAMAQLAKGTNLGVEGAAAFAAEMDNFGVSMETTRDYVEQTVNSSHEMGLNTSKVIKNLQNNLKLANKYNFKNGIKGLAHMAQLSTKFKVDMGMVSGMADKLFDIEGAVDMSAQLQVMGGEWAKLADPFKLMYQAREDTDALFESVVNATKGAAKFNKESGDFTLSGMELHKLKTVAEATGLDFEQLAQSAKSAAKFSKIKSSMNISMDEKTTDFITSMAEYDATKGQYKIQLTDDKGKTVEKYVNALSANDKAMIATTIKQKATLKEQAENARNFEDEWNSTINMFKSAVLPLVKELNTALVPEFQKFREKLLSGGFIDSIKLLASNIGSFIGNMMASPLIKFMGEYPKLTTTLVGAFGIAQWFSKGMALGKGFMSVANMGGGSGGGMFGKFGKTKGGMSFGKSLSKGLKGGGALGLLGGAAEVGRGMMDEPDSNLGKAIGAGAKAAEWGATGALIGSVIPGVGTAIGGIIGAVAGGAKGIYDEYFSDESKQNTTEKGKPIGDGVVQNGKVKAITNDKDVIMAMKPNGPLANTIGGQKSNGVVQNGNVNVSFQPIKIEGTINLNTPSGSFKMDLIQDKVFMRDLSKILQETVREAINGGKLNPNPLV